MKLFKAIVLLSLIALSFSLPDGNKICDPDDNVFPESTKNTDPAYVNAKAQTDAAFNLLEKPGKEALEILTALVKDPTDEAKLGPILMIHNYIGKDLLVQDSLLDFQKWNRGIHGGVLNQDTKDATTQFSQIQNSIDTTNHSAKLRAGLLAFAADLGTVMSDGPEKTGSSNQEDKDILAVFNAIGKYLKDHGQEGLGSHLGDQGVRLKKERGGSMVAPDKKKAPNKRGFVYTVDDCSKAKPSKFLMDWRSGIFNLGQSSKLRAKWPWQTVSKAYVDNNLTEPWAGHFSGSIVEILGSLDTFTQKSAVVNPSKNKPLDTFVDGKDKTYVVDAHVECKAALASAFLIGVGYHSAIEILPTVLKYFNKDVPLPYSTSVADHKYTDDLKKYTDGKTPSEYVIALMKKCTKEGKKKLLKKK